MNFKLTLLRRLAGILVLACLAPVGAAEARPTFLLLNSEPGDYIGRGIHQVFTPADGIFCISRNFDGRVSISFFGSGFGTYWFANFKGPYDGDGKIDPAVFRPSTGGWYVLKSSAGYSASFGQSWGMSTDTPAPADYDGDGRTDPAVFRPSTGGWYVLRSSTSYTTSFGVVWGLGTDKPINGRQ